MKPEHKEYFLNLPENKLMGLCIWAEARSEGVDGRIAVGSVILNRADFGNLHDPWGRRYGRTIHTVIMAPWQFSWLNSIPPQTVQDKQYDRCVAIAKEWEERDSPSLKECLDVADGLLDGSVTRNVSAIYYHTITVHPKWADKLVKEKTIGNHVFYWELTNKDKVGG